MSKYTIKDHIDKNIWSDFVFYHPNGNIFQAPEMFEIYNKTNNYEPVIIGAYDKDNNLAGVLLAVIQKEHKGVLGKLSSRSIIMGGPLVKNNDPDILDFLLKEYNKKIGGKAIYTQVRNLFDQSWAKEVFEKNGFRYEPHLDILININVTQEELTKGIKREKRRNFTKSKNKGVQLKEIDKKDELEKGLALIDMTYKRVKLPMPDKSLFINAFDLLFDKGLIKVFGAYLETKIIGIRIVLTYNNMIYDWFAGSDDENRNMYPNDFLIFNILLWGLDKSFSVFDFGGAGKPGVPYGVRDHKIKFGGDLVEYGRFENVHNPILMKIGLLGFQIYKKFKS